MNNSLFIIIFLVVNIVCAILLRFCFNKIGLRKVFGIFFLLLGIFGAVCLVSAFIEGTSFLIFLFWTICGFGQFFNAFKPEITTFFRKLKKNSKKKNE